MMKRTVFFAAVSVLVASCGGSSGGAPAVVDDVVDDVVEVGLDARPQNTQCVAPQRIAQNAAIATVDAFPNLPGATQPTKLLLEPVPNPRWFLLEKTGLLRVFDAAVADSFTTYLDLSSVVRANSEGGLLGMAFHPDYPTTPEIFLSYTTNHTGPNMRSVISRFILDDVTSPGAGTVENIVLQVDQDFDNHNGGDIAFGTDGMLYIGLGDGGSGGDPNDRAQDTRHMLGSFLRIDVLDPSVSYPANPYLIPSDNPFAPNPKCGPGLNGNDCPEIYAWGLRNPWRFSFDPDNGQLWAADVGQGAWEEVDIIERGGNYGWRCREGAHDYNQSGCGVGFVEPVSEYAHDSSGGTSITGGFVYRGAAIPELAGRYLFGDYGSGRIWALRSDGQGGYTNEELLDTNFGISSFAVDAEGEHYFTDIFSGRVHKIVPTGSSGQDNIAVALSASGCVSASDVTQPNSGLVPYTLNAPFWSDGADKDRYIGIPDGTTINFSTGDWSFPNGSVIVKNFRLNGRLIETRHLMKHPDGVWAGYTYEWNSNQTEATRVVGGKTVSIDGQDWVYPSESECMQCHTSAAGFALGLETAQLNRDFRYPATQRVANQIETLAHIGMFAGQLPGPVASLPALANPADTGASLDDRARAYLHTNCAQCHRPGGPTPTDLDLRYNTALSNTNACEVLPQQGDLGVVNARIIAPGDASRSVLAGRTNIRDVNGMPPLASNLVDNDGVALISGWINNLSGCN
ncbi:MAG: PQQ-dependent sugar dehydrogenase [Gammaproteobacteria bacterium]|nr:PQQ-dependent sugar dehydrogenase [Gammaproteobacteria bacterium]